MNLKGATMSLLLLPSSHSRSGESSRAPTRPVWPTKAWEVSTPEAQGMDSRALG